MQLTRLTAVLIAALPAIVSAAQCTSKTAATAPSSVVADYVKIRDAVQAVLEKAAPQMMADAPEPKLMKRQEDEAFMTADCKDSAKCLLMDEGAVCYNEKTGDMYTDGLMIVNLKNGDLTFFDNTKANAFTDTQGIVDFMNKQMNMSEEEAVAQMKSLDSKVAAAATGAAAAGSAKPSASGPAATGSAKPTGALSGNATAPASPSKSDDASSAGKVAGQWGIVALVAAAAAVVVV